MAIMAEDIRVCVNDFITGTCLDCNTQVTGRIGVRFLEVIDAVGLEVCACVDGHFHPIARIPYDVIPTVKYA
jgi:hypothetical protein